MGLFVLSVNGQPPSPPLFVSLDVGASAQGCTVSGSSISCTMTLVVPTGSVVFSVRTFAQKGGLGNPISVGSATTSVVQGQTIDLPVDLRPVVSSYSYVLSPNRGRLDQPLLFTLTATTRDSAGDVITGDTPYYLPLTVTTKDNNPHVTATPALPAKLNTPSETISFSYDGLGTASSFTVELGAGSDSIVAGEAPTSGAVLFGSNARHLYVSSQFNHAVYVYDIEADGSLSGPSRTITGSQTGLTNPTSLMVDELGAVYVTNYQDSVVVFEPGVDGNVAPQFTFATSALPTYVANNGTSGYAIVGNKVRNDSSQATVYLGTIYSSGTPPGTPIFAETPFIIPSANSIASSPQPNRVGDSVWTCAGSVNPANNGVGAARCYGNPIQINATGYATNEAFDIPGSPNAVAFRPDGALIMANQNTFYNPSNVTTWPMPGEGATSGPTAPLTVIKGASTGLVTPIHVTFDPVTSTIWVADTGNASYNGSVKVWPADADGDVAPTHVLSGLNYPFGVAVGP